MLDISLTILPSSDIIENNNELFKKDFKEDLKTFKLLLMHPVTKFNVITH